MARGNSYASSCFRAAFAAAPPVPACRLTGSSPRLGPKRVEGPLWWSWRLSIVSLSAQSERRSSRRVWCAIERWTLRLGPLRGTAQGERGYTTHSEHWPNRNGLRSAILFAEIEGDIGRHVVVRFASACGQRALDISYTQPRLYIIPYPVTFITLCGLSCSTP